MVEKHETERPVSVSEAHARITLIKQGMEQQGSELQSQIGQVNSVLAKLGSGEMGAKTALDEVKRISESEHEH